MEKLNAWIESPFSAEEKGWIKSSVKQVTEMYAESLILANIYKDSSQFTTAPRPEDASDSLMLKALLSSRLKCLNASPFQVGDTLQVELSLEGQKESFKALAIVVRQLPHQVDGQYFSALRIVAVSPNRNLSPRESRELKPRYEIGRQYAWA